MNCTCYCKQNYEDDVWHGPISLCCPSCVHFSGTLEKKIVILKTYLMNVYTIICQCLRCSIYNFTFKNEYEECSTI